jgi:hypothetical protein
MEESRQVMCFDSLGISQTTMTFLLQSKHEFDLWSDYEVLYSDVRHNGGNIQIS